MFTLASFN